jgi:dynamin 1-like protein
MVVGAQSVGKTSLLNSIMGRDVLPQGDGMVTLCPIILEMICVQSEKEVGYQILFEGRKFCPKLDDIQEQIRNAMKSHVGSSKVSKDPLKVRYQNIDIPNLTLVDLPGLIKVKFLPRFLIPRLLTTTNRPTSKKT